MERGRDERLWGQGGGKEVVLYACEQQRDGTGEVEVEQAGTRMCGVGRERMPHPSSCGSHLSDVALCVLVCVLCVSGEES